MYIKTEYSTPVQYDALPIKEKSMVPKQFQYTLGEPSEGE